MGRTSERSRADHFTAATERLFLPCAPTVPSEVAEEICAKAGTPKGSFYHFFESKQALALEIIDLRWGSQRGHWQRVLDGEGPLVDRLRELFAFTVESPGVRAERVAGVVCGCPFGT